MTAVSCRDCISDGITTRRPTPYPGPRCTTHFRLRRAAVRAAAHEGRVVRTYGLKPGDYKRLLDAQGGVCAGCGPRTGRNGSGRRLAVDHDHSCCPGPASCGRCVRGLLCSTCNQEVGDQRDDPETFERLAAYLRFPPARVALR